MAQRISRRQMLREACAVASSIAAQAVLQSCGLEIVAGVVAAAPSRTNPVVLENQQPGTSNWKIGQGPLLQADDSGQIRGYASATSVNKGESIGLHISLRYATTYTIDIYRMGYYGGAGGRLMQHIGPLPGIAQPTGKPATDTGLLACGWQKSYTLAIPPSWTSGIYLAVLTNNNNYQSYIIFVVRDDERRADLLFQQAVTTYQAYNNYPSNGTGKSLYDPSGGENTVVGSTRACKVSFDRPYSPVLGPIGAGLFFNWEAGYVRWLEQAGYDVAYATNIDTHQNGERLLNYKGFLSIGHDEYWSKAMRDAAEAARDAGVNLGFFSANTCYWQVRFEPSASGVADRVMVCYKNAAVDRYYNSNPQHLTTVLWRDPLVNRPEQTLIGVMFTAQMTAWHSYIPINTNHWLYQNTGFATNRSGVPAMIGYETDRRMSEYPAPVARPGSDTLLAKSPVTLLPGDTRTEYQNTSIYQAPSGAWVFGGGSIQWSFGLDGTYADQRVQRLTANVLDTFSQSQRPRPFAPANLVATATAAQTVALTWQVAGAEASSFLLERSSGNDSSNLTNLPCPVSAGQFVDSNLAAATSYRYRIKAIGPTGLIAYSNTAFVTTPGATTPAPSAGPSATEQPSPTAPATAEPITTEQPPVGSPPSAQPTGSATAAPAPSPAPAENPVTLTPLPAANKLYLPVVETKPRS